MKNVVIVESPAKCKTINKYLGKDYTVLASFGHIRDLPSKDGSVRPDDDFAMEYEVSADSKKHVKAITDAVKNADSVILATDPDREGEAISWHVLETLKQKKALKDQQVQRVTFSSITKKAVLDALDHPRDIDLALVNAQQARRALDYLVGFNLSPVLWRKLPGSRSAGRVQSVALRIICDREAEIEAFKSDEFWQVHGIFEADGNSFQARLTHADGIKLQKLSLNNEASATSVLAALNNANYHVAKVETKQVKRHPYAPFTTSTLQQEASRKLGFSAKQTMQVAQKLYEGFDIGGETSGLITYMRTDGTDIAPEALFAARDLVESKYGKAYLPEKPRTYSKKAKNAQEAHEAIRPTDPKRLPESVKKYLNDAQFKLYDLIWKRLIASQMESVVMDQVSADIVTDNQKYIFRATGSTIRFDGFYKAYREGWDDKATDDDEGVILPPLTEKQSVTLGKVAKDDKNPNAENPFATQHFTQPPPRFTEASLVKRLEELGIGRPSTYASIISVLQDRDYVTLEQKRFNPEPRGRIVTAFLHNFFPRYVEYNFTATLEDELDVIASGEMDWKESLRRFWGDFSLCVDAAMELKIEQVITEINRELEHLLFPGDAPLEERRTCPSCADGTLSLKLGKFGAFIGCSNYPDCRHTTQLSGNATENESAGKTLEGTKILGSHPETGDDVSLRKGPYGFYVQLGEAADGAKPKRSSLPKGMNAENVTLEQAVSLLALPREVGIHPETGKKITANNGRYGPYIQHDKKFISLKGEDSVLTIGMNRAVTLIAEAAEKKPRGAEPLRQLGEHPDGGEIAVYDGKYGPYVKHKKTNATLPKNVTPEDVTLEQAVELIKARAAKGATKKPATRRKKSA